MVTMNEAKITFEGNLGNDPELRFLPDGVAVCEVSVAVTGRKKVGDEWKDGTTTWFRVVAWRRLAETLAEYAKGTKVFVTGTMVQETWEKDDKKGTTLKVTAEGIYLAPKFGDSKPKPADDPWAAPVSKEPFDDSPPF
jgi:single-strand DNA-binding protein